MRAWMKERREAKGLSLRQAGNAMGISASYLKLIEDGVRQKNLDLTMAYRIGRLYGLSITKIFEYEGF